MSSEKKYVLPFYGLTYMQRIMVSARVNVGDRKIGVYCLHDDVYLSAHKKRDMAEFVLEHISDDDDHVVVAGDFNTYTRRAQRSVEKIFERARFVDATPNTEWTSKHWYLFNKKSKIDLIFGQNMRVIDSGMVVDRTASDHNPIWTKLKFEDPQIAFK